MFRKPTKEEEKAYQTGKKLVTTQSKEVKHSLGRKKFSEKPSDYRREKLCIRMIPTVVTMEKPKEGETISKDFIRIFREACGTDISKHKYFECLNIEASSEISRDKKRYGKYGVPLMENLDKKLDIVDKGKPIDCLDFLLYIRDEFMKKNKKEIILASRDCAKLLTLHRKLKSVGAKEYANLIIRTEYRHGSDLKTSKTNISQIVFG